MAWKNNIQGSLAGNNNILLEDENKKDLSTQNLTGTGSSSATAEQPVKDLATQTLPGTGTTGGTTQTKQDSNQYVDISGNKQNYTSGGATGGGAEAALGTQYSWDKQGSQQAQKQYETDVINQEQTMLANRQTIENNAVNYQTQADMMKYQASQNAEKVGWTGGYVLDQNRQNEYLKQSIQAQMYGAMELQKYGYDSALAAARLSYDLNQQEYAHKYYQDAVSAALSEAQLTGTYFSAETKDMMSQLAVAKQKKADTSLSSLERREAEKLEKTIEDWFSSNGISKAGVQTLEAWQADQDNELRWSQENWTRYNAALETTKNDMLTNTDMFIKLGEDGKELWDGVNIETGNWKTMSATDILNYLVPSNNVNQQAAQQYYSYLDTNVTGQIETDFTKWLETNDYIGKDDKGNKTVKKNVNYGEQLSNFLAKSDIVSNLTKQYSELINAYPNATREEQEKMWKLRETLESWDFTIQLPDGTSYTTSFKQLQQLDPQNGESGAGQEKGTKEGTFDHTNNLGEEEQIKFSSTSYTIPADSGKVGYNGDTYYKSNFTFNGEQHNICFTTGKVTKAGADVATIQNIDLEVKLFEGDASGTSGLNGYGVDVSSNVVKKTIQNTDLISSLYQGATGKTLEGGEVFVIDGKAYFYNNKNTGPVKSANEGVYEITQQCGSTGNLQSALERAGQWVN